MPDAVERETSMIRAFMNLCASRVYVNTDMCFSVVTKYTGCPRAVLLARRRTAYVANARMLLYWVLRRHAHLNVAVIGELVERDASTISHGILTVDKWQGPWAEWRDKFEELVKREMEEQVA